MSWIGRTASWGALVWALLMRCSPPAAAQGVGFSIPEACGSEAEFRSELRKLTGDAQAPEPGSLVIEAVGEARGGYELRLDLGDERRVLHDPDCRVLVRGALVIVAAAARTKAAGLPAPGPAPTPSAPAPVAAPPTPPAPTVAPAPTAPPPPVVSPAASSARQTLPARAAPPSGVRAATAGASPERAPVAPRSPIVQGGVGIGAGVSGGVVPGLGATFELSGRVELLPWAVLGTLRYWPPRSVSREGRGLDVSAIGAQLAAQYRIATALNLMLGLEMNRLEGSRTDRVSDGNDAAAWQFATDLGVTLVALDIQYLRLEVGALGRVSWLRPKFVVEGFGDLYRAPVVGGDAIIRGVWLFP